MNESTHIRKCPICGLNFSKPPHYSKAQFINMGTCSRDCGYISAMRKKREYAQEVHDKYISYSKKNAKHLNTITTSKPIITPIYFTNNTKTTFDYD